jgi:hypothetical protein
MSTFEIEGNKFQYKFWKFILNIAQNKIKKHENLKISVSNIVFPTPSSLLIKFNILNTNSRYELLLQGNYIEAYKKYSNSEDEITSNDVNAEEIIRQKIDLAYKINDN